MPTHPDIYASTDAVLSEADLRALSSDLSAALGADRVLDLFGRGFVYAEDRGGFDLLPDALPRTGSVFRVHLSTPYYGRGYERGHWPEIAAALEFLRRRLPCLPSLVWA